MLSCMYVILKSPQRGNGEVLVLTFITGLLHLGVGSSVCSARKQLTCPLVSNGFLSRGFLDYNRATLGGCGGNERFGLSLNPLFCLFIPKQLFLSSPSSELTLLFCTDYVDLSSGSSNGKGVSYDM